MNELIDLIGGPLKWTNKEHYTDITLKEYLEYLEVLKEMKHATYLEF